jgi:3,4-dihydroxy 2-butanone 4-phosphate synthase/GTP cyclohydrolase II
MNSEIDKLGSVAEAIEAVRAGRLVVVVDDEERENEGDLIMAAAKATPELVAFMIRHTSGILCTPLSAGDARRLNLPPMVGLNEGLQGTAFTVSVDYRYGLTTGIAADERCCTIRALANGNSGPSDFARPGHIFPLIAREGGVLMRSGHTEAAVDLARLAGLPPVGLLAELVNDDGTVKRGPDILVFAAEHNLKVISVADLIAYRQQRERLIERVREFPVTTPAGEARGYAYRTPFDEVQHLALVFGALGSGEAVPTRLHREEVVSDVFGGGRVLTNVFERFRQGGRGVLIYLREGAAGVPAGELAEAQVRDGGRGNSEAARVRQWREIGVGAQILRDLGIKSIRLLATRPRQYVALAGFGIAITETEIIA